MIYPWEKMTIPLIDKVLVDHMSLPEKIEWLEVNKPKEMEELWNDLRGEDNE